MAHFSKFMRPGAVKIGCVIDHKEMMTTAVKNPDGSIAVAVFNPTESKQTIKIQLNNQNTIISIDAKALQTILIKQTN
jgi:glucosylceramidase